MDRQEQLGKIALEIKDCRQCSLYQTATNPVPGNGSSEAEIVFIGEAPGFNEDQQGLPFCGAAGRLLDKLLGEIGLKREQVFVANMLKHRPPNNRDPLPEEMAACQDYLDRQLAIIQPKVIVTLGRFAMSKFLPYGKISRDHGQAQAISYQGRSYLFVPLFHPAAALRASEIERQLRDDFLKIPEAITRWQAKAETAKPTEEQLAAAAPEAEQLQLV